MCACVLDTEGNEVFASRAPEVVSMEGSVVSMEGSVVSMEGSVSDRLQ